MLPKMNLWCLEMGRELMELVGECAHVAGVHPRELITQPIELPHDVVDLIEDMAGFAPGDDVPQEEILKGIHQLRRNAEVVLERHGY